MVIKLDFSKEFDKLRWAYLLLIMKAFGFFDNWAKWVASLFSFPFFSILINGSSSTFSASRGIRQEDSLSHFCFSLFGKGLKCFLRSSMIDSVLCDICLNNQFALITQQHFVNDTMFIGKPFIQEALALKNILNDIILAFRTKIKPKKSQVFFFNTHHSIQTHLACQSHPERKFLEIFSRERYFGYNFLQKKQLDIQSLTLSRSISFPQMGASVTPNLQNFGPSCTKSHLELNA